MKVVFLYTLQIFILLHVGFSQVQRNAFFNPRLRVIVDNDFSGDPDGLFQLAHLALSTSVDIRAVIGSHLKAGDWFDKSTTQADNAARVARELLGTLNIENDIPVISGSNVGMTDNNTPVRSKAVDYIIREAQRTDTKAPLYILCGAGLTEIASALLTSPGITDKITLIWIGGSEYKDLAFPPPNGSPWEYNLNIDTAAASFIFNHSQVSLWQIPRNAYRQCLVSMAELKTNVKPYGKTGNFLYEALAGLLKRGEQSKWNLGETYILGDSPLVLLTALQSSFEPDASSSAYVIKKAPFLNRQGGYEENLNGRDIRIYTSLDTRLMFGDFFSKLKTLK